MIEDELLRQMGRHKCPKCGAIEACMGSLIPRLPNPHSSKCNKCGYKGKGFKQVGIAE